jgi:energy-coupling factor transporter ATP-binding protein EcfA2
MHGKSTLLNVLSGIVPNLIDLPLKYDALEVDPSSGVYDDPFLPEELVDFLVQMQVLHKL